MSVNEVLTQLQPQQILSRLEELHAEERLLRAVLREMRLRERRRGDYVEQDHQRAS